MAAWAALVALSGAAYRTRTHDQEIFHAKPPSMSGEVTRLLEQAGGGSAEAFDRLFHLVYEDLRSVAHARMGDERPDHTLSPTALVHEAYVRLVEREAWGWSGRAHFFAAAATAMRRILIDHARARSAQKRGGGASAVPLEGLEEVLGHEPLPSLVALDEAMKELAEFNQRGARVVEYRFFGGLSHGEIAEVLGVSEPTARRSWTMARAWLRRELTGQESA